MKNQLAKLTSAAHRIRLGTRTVALLLSIIMLFLFIPPVVYVKAAEALSSDSEEITDAAEPSTDGSGTDTSVGTTRDIYEDITLREESVKHFRLPDGSFVAAQYSSPVHTLDEDGEWQDIDNTLTESSGIFADKNARIKFQKKITGNETLFTLKDKNTKLELSLEGANKGTVGTVTNGTDTGEDTELGKLMSLEKLTASVLYADILDGIDVEYVANSLSVKENIIVKEKKDSYVYTFSLKLNGMTAALTDGGDVTLTDTSSGEVKYVIPAPVVYDAAGTYAPSTAAHYTLASKGTVGKYTLTVTADAEWMNSDERAFPITVDPTVRYDYTSMSRDYTFNSDGSTESNASLTVSPTSHAVISHSLSGNIRYDYISSVKINLKVKGFLYDNTTVNLPVIGAYGAISYESSEIFNSSSYGAGYYHTSIPLDYQKITESNGWYSFDITDTAIRYAQNEINVGVIILKIMNEGTVVLHSTRAMDGAKPYVVTTYRNMTGVEDYWTGTTQRAAAVSISPTATLPLLSPSYPPPTALCHIPSPQYITKTAPIWNRAPTDICP